MNKQQALAWFRRIQQGVGTYPERMKYLEQFGAGRIAEAVWHDGKFTLGLEYGILIALVRVFDLQKADLALGDKKVFDGTGP